MSKSDDFSDIGEIFQKEVIDAIASSILDRLNVVGPLIHEECLKTYRKFPEQLRKWMGEEGHEEPVVPDTQRRYLPLSKTYLVRKRKKFSERGKFLGGRQAFYSYSGALYEELDFFWLNEYEISKLVKVQASLDGSNWFSVFQRNYSALKSRLKQKLKKLQNVSYKLEYRILIDNRVVEQVLKESLEGDNLKKLTYNDTWRPFLTPAIKYFNKKFLGGRVNEILKEL